MIKNNTEIFELDNQYSTTRCVTHTQPVIVNNPEDKIASVVFLSDNPERKAEGGLRTQGYFKENQKDKPLISVITVVFNGAEHIEQTINSVLGQTYDNVEYIIIDGGSTDGTLDIIKEYEGQVDYWVSEKDKGIYDAWNKGLKLSSGEIIGFANADDYYEISTFVKIALPLIENPFQLTYGITQFIVNDRCAGINNSKFNSAKIYNGFGFMHTTVFTTKMVYQKIGNFDDTYKIAGDVDWLIRAYQNRVIFTQLDNLTYMRKSGISNTLESQAFQEYSLALIKHDFDINKIKLALQRRTIIRFLNDFFGEKNITFVKFQINLIILKSFNLVYNYLPFFILKKQLLRLFSIELGNSSYIHTPVKLFSKGRIKIENNSTINHDCYLDNRGNIKIGSNVSISHLTKIYTAGHEIDNPFFTYKVNDVEIEDNVVVFSNVLIMPGVKIKKNAVIYPGSVVVKDVEEFSIVGGNPAKHIRFRNCNGTKYRIDNSYWFAQ